MQVKLYVGYFILRKKNGKLKSQVSITLKVYFRNSDDPLDDKSI